MIAQAHIYVSSDVSQLVGHARLVDVSQTLHHAQPNGCARSVIRAAMSALRDQWKGKKGQGRSAWKG
eukprot:4635753-Prorocentrum_lima.AAC.1